MRTRVSKEGGVSVTRPPWRRIRRCLLIVGGVTPSAPASSPARCGPQRQQLDGAATQRVGQRGQGRINGADVGDAAHAQVAAVIG